MKAGRVLLRIMRILGGMFTAIITILSVVALIAIPVASNIFTQTLNVTLGHKDYKVKNTEDIQYFESDFTSTEALVSYEEEICKQILEEGIVLLKNENEVLPLEAEANVSVFGQNSVDLVYGGTGAGSVDTTRAGRLKEAFQKAGIEMNPILWDFYDTGAGSSYRKQVPSVTGAGGFSVNEVPQSVYTEEIKASYREYSDAAIVMLGRSGGESADLSFDKENRDKAHYLELSLEEREMLTEVCRNFEKVIVVINSSNPMELGFINEFNVDACVWIGALGQTGVYAIGEVLNGTVNPSGHLVDTYAYDAMSAPAMENFGDYTITNSSVVAGNKYMVYAEGIYVGYRYYETRYEDVVLGNASEQNYHYSKTVQFPFGYGLSYTDFEWSDYHVEERSDSFEVSVKVKNVGDTAGKDVVQIYMQSPYTEYDKKNQLEKAAVELVGFAKTEELQPGQTEQITIAVDKEEMKAYDAKGYGTYIVAAGEYYLAAGENAHTALNHILAAKGQTKAEGMDEDGNAEFSFLYEQKEMDITTYKVAENGAEIKNQFEAADMQYYDKDFTYLSRSDWEGTWPSTYEGGEWEAKQEVLTDLEIQVSEPSGIVGEAKNQGVISETYGKLSVADLIGAEFSDPKWEALISQMTAEEMYHLVRMGGYATVPLESINLPGTLDKDGPAGISSTLMGGVGCMAYPPEVVIASTWNINLSEEMGRLVGEDSLYSDINVWYAPAMNIHRSAFSGRNFEYYSEDSYLSGKIGAAEVKGVQEKGVIVTLKHFALNDQETNRVGLATFANEQSIRENYLKAFEMPVRESKANGVMTSMNRIGTRWSGGHSGLMTKVLRNEWGFTGMAVTDQASFSSFNYCDIYEGLGAGTDLWLNVATNMWKPDETKMTDTVIVQLRSAVHHILYNIANSNAMNGISADAEIKISTPTWKYWRIGIMVLLVLWIGLWAFLTKRLWFGKRKKMQIEVS